ncbi:MAG: response regulator [Syntrophothermus sp.]
MAEIKNILIVEDETVIALSLRILLMKAGYIINGIFARGEQAVKAALENRPDLVLMDIRLAGDMDGIEAAKQIAEHTNSPILFMTAYSDPEVREKAMELKPLGFLQKPVKLTDIEQSLKTLCA